MLRTYARTYAKGLEFFFLLEQKFREAEDKGQGKQKLDQEDIAIISRRLQDLIDESKLTNLRGIEFKATQAQSIISTDTTCADVAEILGGVNDRIREELSNLLLLHVKHELAPFYDSPLDRWEGVTDYIPDTDFDIREAGRCLALGLHTACVFHLMRVAELGLRAIARRLRVTLARGKPVDLAEWQEILSAIRAKTEELRSNSKTNARRGNAEAITYYSEIRIELAAFKDAWRNHVAHARARYDEHQARSAYEHVRSLMQRIAAGPP
ncbi:MAG TPA: hypothetical protein VK610_01530 [Rhodothermales bacterium]|nr:hypothetical protein [Rhodothermales bacterium]